MADIEIIQELRERLIKIETILEQKFSSDEQKNTILEKKIEYSNKVLEKRIDDLEDDRKWLWRTVLGAIIGTIIAFIIKK